MPEELRKKAVLFDVDDTLYDQTVPFMEAYAQYFGENPPVPARTIYPVTRKYSDQIFSRAMAGEITMDELYIYRVKKAFEEGIVTREEVFVSTKLWPSLYEQPDVVEKTLQRLDTDYIDLLLIHQPVHPLPAFRPSPPCFPPRPFPSGLRTACGRHRRSLRSALRP